MTNTKRGFTLIELLVVIAIIGILSSVVLASLNTARAKGADAAIKSNLNNIRAQAELVYDDAGGSYAGVCANTQVTNAVNAAVSAAGTGTLATRCGNAAGAWAAWSNLKTDATSGWCVDSTGIAKIVGTGSNPAVALPAGAVTVCP